MKKTDLAYIAGIIDGEGSIMITKTIQDKYLWYVLRVSVGSTNEWLPCFLKIAYGGYIYKKRDKRPQNSQCWEWDLQSRQALVFLQDILPYLHLKKPQAELAIRFQQARRNPGGKGKTEGEKAVDEAQRILMKELKHQK